MVAGSGAPVTSLVGGHDVRSGLRLPALLEQSSEGLIHKRLKLASFSLRQGAEVRQQLNVHLGGEFLSRLRHRCLRRHQIFFDHETSR